MLAAVRLTRQAKSNEKEISMGLFDVFCNVIAGGAAAQHDQDVHGTSHSSGAFAASEARRMAGTGHGAQSSGYAGHAARLGTTKHKAIDEA